VRGPDGPVDVTRAEWNASFGAELKTPDDPEIPDCLTHVWGWWWELHSRRQPAFDGEAPLSYADIYHWSQLTRNIITPDEIQILMRMDDAYREQMAVERKERHERDQPKGK
jgi:hypothetical protein